MKRPNRNRPNRPERATNPMAETQTAPDATQAPDATTGNGSEDEAKRPRISTTIHPDLKAKLEAYAKEKDMAEAGVVRQALYQLVGIEMPAEELTFGTKRKYASEEEKKQAQKNKKDELKSLVALAAQARSKGIDLATLIQQAAAAQSAEQAEPSAN